MTRASNESEEVAKLAELTLVPANVDKARQRAERGGVGADWTAHSGHIGLWGPSYLTLGPARI